MITKEDLLKQISGTIGKTKVLELSRILKERNFALRDLIDLTFIADKDVAFRAAWLLENMFLQDPESYMNDLDYLVSRIKAIKHESCQRHYAKILMHITAKKSPASIRRQVEEIDLGTVVEQCFDWLIDPKVKIAVKCFSAEALCNLRTRDPWIREELANQLEFLMRDGSAGIQSRSMRLLETLSQ